LGPPSFSWGWLEWRSHGLPTLVIIIVVHIRAVKIYVAAVEALRKKERGDETQFTTKIGAKN
jgi:hypothetical protein